MPALEIGVSHDLDSTAVLRIARGDGVRLSESARSALDQRHRAMLAALRESGPVYGVTTGMGALSETVLSVPEQQVHQEALLVARSVGGPPYLDRVEVRAVLAARLRSFLNGDAAVGVALLDRLVAALEHDVLPAVPRTPTGVAGEIVELAHLGNAIVGRGDVLDGDEVAPALSGWESVGLGVLSLAPKEGVALLEGIPVATGLAVLALDHLRRFEQQAAWTLAGEFAVTAAGMDSADPAVVRGDEVLAAACTELRRRVGATAPRNLQSPVSFRVGPHLLAQLNRSTGRLEESVTRALEGVTDSPAFVTAPHARFVGTAGFFGYDLASHLHAATVAVIGVAETGAARLHRMMDPAVTGLPAQLSANPGPQTGVSPVHKRAIGITHALRRLALPATIGPVEASAGQEDVQAFTLEAVAACRAALAGATDVLACELLAAHQARCLGAAAGDSDAAQALDELARELPSTPDDRAFGKDIVTIRRLLDDGWPQNVEASMTKR